MFAGLSDYLRRPWSTEESRLMVERANEIKRRHREWEASVDAYCAAAERMHRTMGTYGHRRD